MHTRVIVSADTSVVVRHFSAQDLTLGPPSIGIKAGSFFHTRIQTRVTDQRSKALVRHVFVAVGEGLDL